MSRSRERSIPCNDLAVAAPVAASRSATVLAERKIASSEQHHRQPGQTTSTEAIWRRFAIATAIGGGDCSALTAPPDILVCATRSWATADRRPTSSSCERGVCNGARRAVSDESSIASNRPCAALAAQGRTIRTHLSNGSRRPHSPDSATARQNPHRLSSHRKERGSLVR